jgi:hypothetical protein
MLRKALEYGAVLIGIYLGVNYFTGAEGDVKATSTGLEGIISSLQGKTIA